MMIRMIGRNRHLFLLAFVLLIGCGGDEDGKKKKVPLRDTAVLLNLNLRSTDASCGGLCSVTAETAVAARIGELEPDIILLQSVQSRLRCDDPGDTTASDVCAQTGEQVERLLPAGYAIRCNASGSLCFGVRRSTGAEMPGCPAGLCTGSMPVLAGTTTKCTDYPASAVNFAEAAALPISWWNGAQFRAINVDWTADFGQGFCRELSMDALFSGREGTASLSSLTMPDLAAGTFGFDPYATGSYRSAFTETATWRTFVGNTTATTWSYLSGAKVEGKTEPPVTDKSLPAGRGRVDHVIASRFGGQCQILDGVTTSLWDTPGGNAVLAADLRHYGLLCQLDLAPLAIE